MVILSSILLPILLLCTARGIFFTTGSDCPPRFCSFVFSVPVGRITYLQQHFGVQTPKSNHTNLEAKQSAGVQTPSPPQMEIPHSHGTRSQKAGVEVKPVSYLYSLTVAHLPSPSPPTAVVAIAAAGDSHFSSTSAIVLALPTSFSRVSKPSGYLSSACLSL